MMLKLVEDSESEKVFGEYNFPRKGSCVPLFFVTEETMAINPHTVGLFIGRKTFLAALIKAICNDEYQPYLILPAAPITVRIPVDNERGCEEQQGTVYYVMPEAITNLALDSQGYPPIQRAA